MSNQNPQDPYGQQPQDPYGQQPQDPYGQQSAGDPYGQQSAGDPYGQQSAGDPYGQQSAGDPYGQQSAGDPYGQQQHVGGQPPYGGGYGAGGPAPQYATWPIRVAGYLIDMAPAIVIGAIIGGVSSASIDPMTGQASGVSLAVSFIGYLLILGWNIYNRWLNGGKTGQSLGRKVMGTSMLSEETNQPVGPLMAFVRDIVHVVDSIICYIGWLFPLWDAKKQTLSDKIMKTHVLVVPKQ
ncbi:MAG: RDD family protein [Propionibacteriaceae bacterium]